VNRRLSPVVGLVLLCGAAAPLIAQTSELEACRRSAYDRYAANSPKVTVGNVGVDGQRNRLVSWTAIWASGNSRGSCLVSPQGQIVRFEDAGAPNTGGPEVQPPVKPLPPVQPVPSRITCESKEARRAECAIPFNSQVRLARTLSTNPCIENRSWGTTDRALWVTSGCRGEFDISARPNPPVDPGFGGGNTRRITCGSPAGNQVQCKTGGYATSVRLVRDLSGNRCRQGDNWGHTDSFIWTNRGCRADFEIVYRNTGAPAPGTRRITCGTGTTSQVQCMTGGYATNVRLVRDMSGNRCRQNSNWGYTDSFIWTNAFCRAEFEITYSGSPGPGPVRPQPVQPTTRTITCGNSYGAQMSCNPFGQVASVRVARDLSNGRCRQGATWGFTQQDLWVKGGCYADFLVTYASMTPVPR
jgi:hypothetical protein